TPDPSPTRGEGSTAQQLPVGGNEFPLSQNWERGPGGEGPAAFRRLIASVSANGRPLRGVIHLWALDDAQPLSPGADPAGEVLDAAQLRVTGGALHLVQALAETGAAPRLWLVTRGAQAAGAGEAASPLHAPLWGLGKVVALEHPELRCVRVDLASEGQEQEADALFAELQASGEEDQVALREDARYVARLVRRQPASAAMLPLLGGQPYQLCSAGPKVLDSLEFHPLERRAPGAGEVEVEVLATGLAFRDVLNALGQYPGPEMPLGGEFAGVVTAVGEGVEKCRVGDPVLGMTPGAFQSFVTTRAELVAPKPAGLTMAEAAALPSAFLTAHYGLHHLARVQAGDKVLIHAGAGGVGMAAIQIARQAGAEVFATAGSPAKRAFLASLGVRHVFDSRSLDFADEVLRATGGSGVDVVLNSLADEFIPRSLEALAENGRFVELGKRGIWDAAQVAEVRPHASYFTVDLGAAAVEDTALIQRLLGEVMAGFENGGLRALPIKTFPMPEAISAFRYMAQARHIGKIVLTHHRAPAIRADATYLITGGLGGVGLSTARWLVEQGARHLVLAGRSAPSEAAQKVMAELEQTGARVVTAPVDVSQPDQVDELLETIRRTLPPLRGVFHSALVLDDGALVQQSWERFQRVFAPRVKGGWLLHARTAHLPLDFFVLFSAAGAVLGS
ncbi:MAG: SDR family NAD(P)-dependent oxidoreductase, partial [Gemmatimonadota bacterium]|nr:SDR family NAD(P)-dependent oxidoreductase [Gemmatimonadota bacterium]